MRKVIVAGICALLSASIQAATGSGRITGYVVSTSGGNPEFVLVAVESIGGTSTPCDTTARFGLSSTDPKYKSVLASVIAAYHAGTQVQIIGLGTCSVWSNAEDISYVCFGSGAC